MIRIKNIRINIIPEFDIYEIASKKLKVSKEKINKVVIHKKSIDARNKMMFAYVLDLDVDILNEDKYLSKNVVKVENEDYVLPCCGNEILNYRPVVIGAGPAGLFCTYMLAKYGYKPILFERGEKIEDRIKTVDELWNKNIR